MKTFADDRTMIATITPDHLRAYLTGQGWHLAHPFLDHAEIWSTSDSVAEAPQILVPTSTTLGDYLPRIREALIALETLENRPQAEILLDLIPLIPNFQTQGIITNLDEGAREGRITLMGILLNKLRRIQIELPEPIYEIALQGYRGRIPILCQGSLVKQSYTFELKNLSQFTFDLDIPAPLLLQSTLPEGL